MGSEHFSTKLLGDAEPSRNETNMIRIATGAAAFAALVVVVLFQLHSTPVEAAEGATKVKVCHIPPGNPENAHVIEVSVNAVEAHLAHGDCLADETAEVGSDCDCDDEPPVEFPGCAGATCETFQVCNAEGTCGFSGVCGTTSEGIGLCVDGSTLCANLDRCFEGQDDCPEDSICFEFSCCIDPVCVPIWRLCEGASNQLFEAYPDVFVRYMELVESGEIEIMKAKYYASLEGSGQTFASY